MKNHLTCPTNWFILNQPFFQNVSRKITGTDELGSPERSPNLSIFVIFKDRSWTLKMGG